MKEYIEIPEDLCNYIEGLMYETNARKDIITFMLRQPEMNDKKFEKYHNEYLIFYGKYEMAKQELVKTYIIPKYGTTKVNWWLDFTNNKLEVSIE